MTGATGVGTFVFGNGVAANAITITDFTHGVDHLAFDTAILPGASALPSGSDLLVDALLTGATTPIATAGALYYDANGTGGLAAVQIATIVGHPALAADDFTLISPA
jgi:Ca2+-binding RTX toxin-like protein